MVSASQLWTQYTHPPQLVCHTYSAMVEVWIKTNAPLKLLLSEFFITKEERSQQRSHEFSAPVYCVAWSLHKMPSVSMWWKTFIHSGLFSTGDYLSPLLRDLWCSWGWIKTPTQNTRFWARVNKHKNKHFEKEIVNPGCLTREVLHTAVKKRDSIVG